MKPNVMSLIDYDYLANAQLIARLEKEYLDNEQAKDAEIEKERNEIRKNLKKSK